MSVIVCTLFENHYHYGLAALINSLYAKGYRGEIYAGYKGNLPQWAENAKPNSEINWLNANTLNVSEDLQIHFLPIEADVHLANYKPSFMKLLFTNMRTDIDGIVYFDPDIVIKCKWSFFEKWIGYGVALVHEIISNDMPQTHPIRKGWIEVAQKINREVTRTINSYINSGFCGVLRKDIEFLYLWEDIINVAAVHYDLNKNRFIHSQDRSNLFFAHDQDAFNIAAMCCNCPVSEMGPEGMDFLQGGFTMSHAIGSPKPWNKKYLISSFKGINPTMADRGFWAYSTSPIRCYSDKTVKIKRISISAAGFIGRFYSKK